MDRFKHEMSVRDVRDRMFRMRKRDLEKRLQDAMLKKSEVEAKMQQLNNEQVSIEMQINGLRDQIREIDAQL